MATLYLRMPADDDSGNDDGDDISAVLDDDDSTTTWTSSEPMIPGQAIIIDRGGDLGDGRYQNMLDGDSASKWSTTKNITAGQAVIIDRGDPVKGIGDPANMLDSDAHTRWTSGINMAPGMAVIIDRGETNVHLFNMIVMDSGTDVDGYARSYTVSVSEDNHTWTQVASGTTPEVVASPIVSTAKFSVQLSRYVKITQTGTASHPWSLTSVRLRYVETGVGSFELASGGWTASIAGITATLPVFNTVVMNSGVGDTYARAFDVAVSTNKMSWTTVTSGSGASPHVAIAFADQHAQYVRILLTASAANVWTLTDIDLLKDATSLDRSAWDIDVAGDVGPLLEFDQIAMDSGANTNGYARSFDVDVSSNGTSWTTVTTGVGMSGVVESVRFPPVTSRYIRIVQQGTAPYYWSLAAVTARYVGIVLDRSSWDVSVSPIVPEHGSDYWLPVSVNAAGPISPDPMTVLDDSNATWFTTHYPVATGLPVVIDRGGDTNAFNNVLVYFGAPLAGQLGWDSVKAVVSTRFQILVSDDKVTWTWLATAYVSGQTLAVLLDEPQTARYIQIVLMEGLSESLTVTHIRLFNGDTPLSRTGWTVTTAQVRSGGGIDRSLLRLAAGVPGSPRLLGWVTHVPPTVPDARLLRLKLPSKAWKTVLSLGVRGAFLETFNAPTMVSYFRRTDYDDVAGARYDDVYLTSTYDADMPSKRPGWTDAQYLSYQAYSYEMSTYASNYTQWIREPVNGRPIGDQVVVRRQHEYGHTTFFFTMMDRVRSYWAGYPVKKLRFGFQVQNYSWDVSEGSSAPAPTPGTFLLYREPTLPPMGVPPTSITGTPIHTFSPIHDWPAAPPVGVQPDHRGEMFWYEIDPAWHDIAFTLCTMWQAFDLKPPIFDPSNGAAVLPDLADGSYEYTTTESAYVKVVFQVVLDDD